MKQQAILGNSLEVLKDFPDNYFDLAILDPSQGNGTATNISKKGGKSFGNSYPIPRGKYPPSEWDLERNPIEFFDEVWRVSKNQICWCATFYTDYPHIKPGKSWLTWRKLTQGDFGDYEHAWTSWDGAHREITYLWNGSQQGKSLKNGHIQQGNKKLNEKRIHPTHKPSKLYMGIYGKYTQTDWKILDPTMGSGSSRVAAYKMGIEYVGIERDEQHYSDHLEWWKDEYRPDIIEIFNQSA